MLAFLEAKAPHKFGVLRSFRYESNRNHLFYKRGLGILKFIFYDM